MTSNSNNYDLTVYRCKECNKVLMHTDILNDTKIKDEEYLPILNSLFAFQEQKKKFSDKIGKKFGGEGICFECTSNLIFCLDCHKKETDCKCIKRPKYGLNYECKEWLQSKDKNWGNTNINRIDNDQEVQWILKDDSKKWVRKVILPTHKSENKSRNFNFNFNFNLLFKKNNAESLYPL